MCHVKVLAACAAVVVVGTAAVGSASSIAIVDADFSQVYTDSTMTTPAVVNPASDWTDGMGNTCVEGADPAASAYVPGWVDTPHSRSVGYYAAGVSGASGSTGDSALVGYLSTKANDAGVGTTLSQTLTTNVAPNTTYTLTFYASAAWNSGATFTTQLTEGTNNVPLVSATVPALDNTFQLETYVFQSGATDSGVLGITFSMPNVGAGVYDNAYIANVALDGTPAVPEPATLSLLGVGSLGLLARRRRA